MKIVPNRVSPSLAIIFYFIIFTISLLYGCRKASSSQELVAMLEKRVGTFDPRMSTDSADERMRQLLFNGLTRKNENFDPVPDLAEGFEVSSDYKTFTFHLRPNIKFHNNQKFSALDVKYTFDTMMAKGFPSAKKVELVQELAAIEVGKDDPMTVVFQCKNPCPGLPNMIIPVGIIPEGTGDQQAKKPVGTGPFKFDSFTEDQEVVLTSYPDYFAGAPSIKRLHVKIIPDNSTRESELRKGSVDLAINADFDPVTVEGLQKAEGLKVELIDGTNITHLGINLQDPVLKDIRVRQALAFAIDRDAIIRDSLRGQARLASSVLPTAQWAYEPNVANYAYNIEKAKQLLDQAGKAEKDGQPRLKLTLKTSTLSIARKIGEAIQAQLGRIGIKLEIQTLERQKLQQDMNGGEFQLYLNTSVGGNQSTDIFNFMYNSRSIPPNGQNRSRYNNPQIDKLLGESSLATAERRKQIFSEIQKVLANDLPQIYLWYPATIIVRRDRVTNLQIEPSGDWQMIRNARLTQ